MKKSLVIRSVLLFIVMLLDGQISTLLMNVFPYQLGISSRLLLLVLIFLSNQRADIKNVFLFAVIGLLYDSYYLNLIGIAATLLPVLASVLGPIRKNIKFNLFNFLLLSLVVVFFYEILAYLLALFINLSQLNFEQFVVTNLAPTLLFNFLQSLLLYPILLTIFKRSRHKIVTLA